MTPLFQGLPLPLLSLGLNLLLLSSPAQAYDETIQLALKSPDNTTYNTNDDIDIAFLVTGAELAFQLGFTVNSNLKPVDSMAILDLPDDFTDGIYSRYFSADGDTPANGSTYTWEPDYTSELPAGEWMLEWELRMSTCKESGSTTVIDVNGFSEEGTVYFTVQDKERRKNRGDEEEESAEGESKCPLQLTAVQVSGEGETCAESAEHVDPPKCDPEVDLESGASGLSLLRKSVMGVLFVAVPGLLL